MFIQANFFVILEAKKLPHLQPSFLSHTFFFKAPSINPFVSRNALLTAPKTAEAIFNRFCPF